MTGSNRTARLTGLEIVVKTAGELYQDPNFEIIAGWELGTKPPVGRKFTAYLAAMWACELHGIYTPNDTRKTAEEASRVVDTVFEVQQSVLKLNRTV